MPNHILLTGGAGFIGSHLAENLLKNNHKIIILDNFNDFYDPQIKHNNIKEIQTLTTQLNTQNNLQTIQGDIRNIDLLDKILSTNQVDTIIHLAAMAGVRPSIENPLLYNDVNITGTLNLLEMAKKHNIQKFIFASSSSVYGNSEKVPFTETDPVDNPISPYAATKKAGELLCHTYHSLYNMDIACLRFFTVYGPRQRPDLAIHKFTDLINNHKEVPFFGDGSTQRDYTYIDDIIDGITKTLTWIHKETGVYEIFNLGESQTISLTQMLTTIEQALNKKAKLKKLPPQPGDVQRTNANIQKAKKKINYNPTTDFEAGIKKFIHWYKNK